MPVVRLPGLGLVPVRTVPAHDRPVAFCADLSPASVLAAYRRGILPFPAPDEYLRTINEVRYEEEWRKAGSPWSARTDADPYAAAWWSPDPRPVIAVHNVHLGRNTRKRLRDGRIDDGEHGLPPRRRGMPGRPRAALADRPLAGTLVRLHDDGLGAQHRGVARRRAGQAARSASASAARSAGIRCSACVRTRARIAVADMAARLDQAGGQLIDAQWDTPFLRSLGAEPMPRERYLPLLAASGERVVLSGQSLPASRLATAPRTG